VQGQGVFLLELDDDIEPEVVADDLGISLHSLTSIDVANTMKLQVMVVGKALVALVDTGSTHTFIQEGVATHLDMYPSTDLDIVGEHFSINMYVLLPGGFDIV
jgi:hypothetical protein